MIDRSICLEPCAQESKGVPLQMLVLVDAPPCLCFELTWSKVDARERCRAVHCSSEQRSPPASPAKQQTMRTAKLRAAQQFVRFCGRAFRFLWGTELAEGGEQRSPLMPTLFALGAALLNDQVARPGDMARPVLGMQHTLRRCSGVALSPARLSSCCCDYRSAWLCSWELWAGRAGARHGATRNALTGSCSLKTAQFVSDVRFEGAFVAPGSIHNRKKQTWPSFVTPNKRARSNKNNRPERWPDRACCWCVWQNGQRHTVQSPANHSSSILRMPNLQLPFCAAPVQFAVQHDAAVTAGARSGEPVVECGQRVKATPMQRQLRPAKLQLVQAWLPASPCQRLLTQPAHSEFFFATASPDNAASPAAVTGRPQASRVVRVHHARAHYPRRPVPCCAELHPRTATIPGQQLVAAARNKRECVYPALGNARHCGLVVFGVDMWGRWRTRSLYAYWYVRAHACSDNLPGPAQRARTHAAHKAPLGGLDP